MIKNYSQRAFLAKLNEDRKMAKYAWPKLMETLEKFHEIEVERLGKAYIIKADEDHISKFRQFYAVNVPKRGRPFSTKKVTA